MVRLKAGEQLSPIISKLFQFHMVRLKVVEGEAGRRQPLQFQFHMVRLKACRCVAMNVRCIVSIPYGTIKRFGGAVPRQGGGSFNSIWYD